MSKHPLKIVLENIAKIQLTRQKNVTLIAVTKKTGVDKIQELRNLGQVNFGENYVDEIVEKSKVLSDEINWHFIGHLQSNKAKKLVQIPNLRSI